MSTDITTLAISAALALGLLFAPFVARAADPDSASDDLADFTFDGDGAEEAGAIPATGDVIEINEKFSFYGYAVNYLQLGVDRADARFQDPTVGDALLVRFKADWRPERRLAFHTEASYLASFGNQNPTLTMQTAGLGEMPQDQFPMQDFNHRLLIDHAWMLARLGPLDLQAGKIPISWGAGYLFAPTSRAVLPPFLDMVTEETPGTLAILPRVALAQGLALEGYLGFQDRIQKKTAEPGDRQLRNLPYGLRFKAAFGPADVSLVWLREVIHDQATHTFMRRAYAGFDTVVSMADVVIYAEAVQRLPLGSDGFTIVTADYTWQDNIEAVLGLEYNVPLVDIDLKVEYFHQGTGAKSTAAYDLMAVLRGERFVQARDYLFAHLERETLDDLSIELAGLINLNDSSFVVLPALMWTPFGNLQLALGGLFSHGPVGSEFRGNYLVGEVEADLVETLMFYGKIKASF